MPSSLRALLVASFVTASAVSSVIASARAVAVTTAEAEPGEEIMTAVVASGQAPPKVASPRGVESEGPFKRLVIQGANLIDGTGAPSRGPMNIVIEGDRIVAIKDAGPASSVNTEPAGTRVIDARGKYVLPGFVDAHSHLGTPSHAYGGALTDPDYVTRLWLAHGVTTIRDAGSLMGLQWTLQHKALAEQGKIASPRIVALAVFPEQTASAEEGVQWVRAVKQRGADGVKFFGGEPDVVAAAIEEAKTLGMNTAYHHAQLSVARNNVLDSARQGLDSMEHWYGLPEAMFTDRRVQDYPYDYNYNNEQDRFGEAGRLWRQAAPRGSDVWQDTIDELISYDFTLVPTFTIYEANRDLMRARNADWNDDYVMPYMQRAFGPDPRIHGAYHFDWTTRDEVDWRDNYKRWMSFVNDYKNRGGRVATGSDSGFIFNTYGFGYIRELELLQEAGFHPLEVVTAATLNGAELLGLDKEVGSVKVGKKADMLIVDENPLTNFKILYGTGHLRFDDATGQMSQVRGLRYTIKDGIVFDAGELLREVREMVAARKADEAGSQEVQ